MSCTECGEDSFYKFFSDGGKDCKKCAKKKFDYAQKMGFRQCENCGLKTCPTGYRKCFLCDKTQKYFTLLNVDSRCESDSD